MAQQVWRLPLENAEFPLLSTLSGSGVAVQNQDVQLQKPNDIPEYRPKIVHCQDVLPISGGLHSITHVQKVAPITVGLFLFDEVWHVVDAAGFYGLFSPASKNNYFSANGTVPWVSNPVAGAVTAPSKATVAGQSYICYALDAIYVINCFTGVLTPLAVIGIAPSVDVKGITNAGNYLIAWNEYTVFWSSPINPADFVPSLITGAGSATPTELNGKIMACYPALNGFYIYTTTGIILAQYSGNTQYPWIYKNIAGASAIRDSESVTHSATDLMNFAITSTGVVKITPQGVEAVFPMVGEFLAKRTFESYNFGLNILQRQTNVTLKTMVTRVGQRYLVISYGRSTSISFEAALVYDFALQRWGKLARVHRYCFAYLDAAITDPGNAIGFMTEAGQITIVSLDATLVGTEGIVMIGNIKLTRSSLLTMHEIEVNAGELTPSLYVNPSMDGKTYPISYPVTADASGLYHCRRTAVAHAIIARGSFALTNLQVTTVQAGAR